MNRRSFLRGLLALPLASLAAKLLPEATAGIPINHTENMKVTEAYVGSDQTSIWMVDWRSPEELVAQFGSYGDFRATEDDKFIAKFTEQLKSGAI